MIKNVNLINNFNQFDLLVIYLINKQIKTLRILMPD